jgi:hypothetical protein
MRTGTGEVRGQAPPVDGWMDGGERGTVWKLARIRWAVLATAHHQYRLPPDPAGGDVRTTGFIMPSLASRAASDNWDQCHAMVDRDEGDVNERDQVRAHTTPPAPGLSPQILPASACGEGGSVATHDRICSYPALMLLPRRQRLPVVHHPTHPYRGHIRWHLLPNFNVRSRNPPTASPGPQPFS